MKNKNNPFSQDDAQAYVEALKTPWQTMAQDIDTALQIIDAQPGQQAEQITLVDKVEHVDNEIHFSFPDWHGPVEAHFVALYGESQGSFIFDKVVMQLFKRARGEISQVH